MANPIELELIEQAQTGTKRERESAETQLLAMHNKYIYKITWETYRKLSNSAHAIDLEDIAQVTKIAFLIAVRRFDSTMNVRLLTYATHWMTTYAKRLVIETGTSIRMPYRKDPSEISWHDYNALSVDRLTESIGDTWMPLKQDDSAYDVTVIREKLLNVLNQLDYHKELAVMLRGSILLTIAKDFGVEHEPCERCGKRPNWKQVAKDRSYARFMELCEQEGVSKEDLMDFLSDIES